MIKSTNKPFQNAAPSLLTLTGSPFTYTNISGTLQYVLVSGGLLVTVSLIGLASLSLSAAAAYILRPNDSLVIGYGTAPTVTVLNLL